MKIKRVAFQALLVVALGPLLGSIPLRWTRMAFSITNQTDEKAREIEDNLIAPCCWSQPVSQHQSAAAEEIRKGVREMLAAGKTREEILEYYVAIHGERILATPRARGFNALVWVMPGIALILGAWLLVMILKRLRVPRVSMQPERSTRPPDQYSAVIDQELRDLE